MTNNTMTQRVIETNNVMNKQKKIEDKVQERIDSSSELENIYGQGLLQEFNSAIKSFLESELSGETKVIHRNLGYKEFFVPMIKAWEVEQKALDAAWLEEYKLKCEKAGREPKNKKRTPDTHPVETVSGLIAYQIVNGISSERVFVETIHKIAQDCWISLNNPSYLFEGSIKDKWLSFFTKTVLLVLVDDLKAVQMIKEEGVFNAPHMMVATSEYTSKMASAVLNMSEGLTVYDPLVTVPKRHNDLLMGSSYQTFSAPLLKHVSKVNGKIPTIVMETTRKNFPEFFETIDKVQETAYCVNKPLLEMIGKWNEEGKSFGKFYTDIKNPTLQERITTDAVKLHEVACQSSKVYCESNGVEYVEPSLKARVNKVRKSFSSVINDTKRVLMQASNYSQYDNIYFGVYLDHRGRVYYYSNSSFQPQGNELGKALLQFANKQEVTEQGKGEIFYNLGNVLGYDKEQADVRITEAKKFFEANLGDFMAGNWNTFINNQEMFEEPITALSYCIELVEIVKNPSYKTGIILHRDARCSGLAINGVIQNDEEACKLTSSINAFQENGKLMDGYQKCANILRDLIQEEVKAGNKYAINCWKYRDTVMTRSSCKHHVMVVANYAGTRMGAGDRIKDQVKFLSDWSLEDSVYLSGKVMEAVELVSESAFSASNFSKELAVAATKEFGGMCFRNTNGFPVVSVEFKKDKNDVVKIYMPNQKPLYIACVKYTNEVNPGKCKTVAAPNVTHSLDANLIMSVRKGFNKNLVTIHDSFGCSPNDVAEMKATYNKALYVMATTDVLGDIAKQVGVDVKVPTVKDMTAEQVESILTADYSLC